MPDRSDYRNITDAKYKIVTVQPRALFSAPFTTNVRATLAIKALATHT